MKETFKTKKVRLTILTLTIAIGMMLVGSNNVQAVLQANATTHSAKLTKKGSEWITQIRDMEKSGGTMGLNASIDETTLMESSTNNIDVHMMKTTEWGAIEILAASGYGAGGAESVGNTSTTNNSTGVYFDGSKWEWTAGIGKELSCNARYYDLYKEGNKGGTSEEGGPKAGDGLGAPDLSGAGCYPGCSGWSSKSTWLSNAGFGFLRGSSGLFSFTGNGIDGNYGFWNDRGYTCRGVAVVGKGL